MSAVRAATTDILRISHSSANTFKGCQRKYFHQKVAKTRWDPDYQDNAAPLRIGSAFHLVLEMIEFNSELLTNHIFGRAFEAEDVDSVTERMMIRAMIKKYLKLYNKCGLKVIAVEVEISTDDFVGYVDSVMVDRFQNWWIIDLKTAARLDGSLLSRLARDQQLNLYAFYVPFIAEKLGLDPEMFAGCRFHITTKCQIKLNKKEKEHDFYLRCYEKVESFDIGIPKKDLAPEDTHDRVMKILTEVRKMPGMDINLVPQSFNNCFDFFKPCPYFSNCHNGKTFTAAADHFNIYNSDTIVDLGFDDLELL